MPRFSPYRETRVASFSSTSSYSLTYYDKLFLQDVIHFIEDTPADHSNDKWSYERSKQLWGNRNRFLATYIETLKYRAVDKNGRDITRQELVQLKRQALALMTSVVAA